MFWCILSQGAIATTRRKVVRRSYRQDSKALMLRGQPPCDEVLLCCHGLEFVPTDAAKLQQSAEEDESCQSCHGEVRDERGKREEKEQRKERRETRQKMSKFIVSKSPPVASACNRLQLI